MAEKRTENQPQFRPPSPRTRATFSWGSHPTLCDVAPLRWHQNDTDRGATKIGGSGQADSNSTDLLQNPIVNTEQCLCAAFLDQCFEWEGWPPDNAVLGEGNTGNRVESI
jgi:hypothetical protein